MDDAGQYRDVRRKAVFAYAYLVTPGVALLALALYDAITAARWVVFAGVFTVLCVFLFYLPLVSHFRCANCRQYFRYERQGLDAGATVYRCCACGHRKREREWCGLTDVMKSSRRIIGRRN